MHENDIIRFRSFKLQENNYECVSKSKYEYYVFQKLDDKPDVKLFTYEPFSDITYLLSGMERRYKPDILVQYTNNSKELIEIKSSKDNILVEENRAKFKAADSYAIVHQMLFTIWIINWEKVDDNIEKWSFEDFKSRYV